MTTRCYAGYNLEVNFLPEIGQQKLWGSQRISNDTQIIIEPHRQTYVCAITGKISTEAVKIGEAWISKEGIKKLIQYMGQ